MPTRISSYSSAPFDASRSRAHPLTAASSNGLIDDLTWTALVLSGYRQRMSIFSDTWSGSSVTLSQSCPSSGVQQRHKGLDEVSSNCHWSAAHVPTTSSRSGCPAEEVLCLHTQRLYCFDREDGSPAHLRASGRYSDRIASREWETGVFSKRSGRGLGAWTSRRNRIVRLGDLACNGAYSAIRPFKPSAEDRCRPLYPHKCRAIRHDRHHAIASRFSPTFSAWTPGQPGTLRAGFSYLDRSARPAFERIRQLLDRWYASFPAAEQAQLRNRVRSGDDHHFLAAMFELYIHEILLRTTHRVEIHRKGTAAKQPDFSATTPDGTPVVLEAIVATETTDAQKGAEKRKSQLYDMIDRLECPDFFLSMEIEGEPNTPIPGDQWLRELRKWVSSLDYDAVAILGQQQAFDLLPTLTLEHDGLVVTFSPIAKKQENRGQTNVRPIGVQSFDAEWVQSWKAIQRAVRKKSLTLRKTGLPLPDSHQRHGAQLRLRGV